ncbi:MAG: DUF2961 domain-containing protein [Pirellulales bacterium]|nr:DUF2961 domain-containing protein [Pirellulales bacterium]
MTRWTVAACVFVGMLANGISTLAEPPVRDLAWFLKRMRTVDHLPELEDSHTAMSSTWDRAGGNADANDFKQITEDGRNILLDVDGPGCIHRMFLGHLGPNQKGTRFQVFLDGAKTPTIDMPLIEFFAEHDGPLPYPIVFDKTYPGTLFPVPFAKHCRVQLVNPNVGKLDKKKHPFLSPWSTYWQIVYTRYQQNNIHVESLRWPLRESDKRELDKTCQAWLAAESKPTGPAEPPKVDDKFSLRPGEKIEFPLKDKGVIRQLRLAVEPDTAEALLGLRLQITFDGAKLPGVDAPVGRFFGHAYSSASKGKPSPGVLLTRRPPAPLPAKVPETVYPADFHSLLLGADADGATARFPMPFADGALIRLENQSNRPIEKVRLGLWVDQLDSIPANWGRFQATWREAPAATPATPKFGPRNVPGHIVLERNGRGKYVGVMLHVDWPSKRWWGEGDWLIWTDEHDWPPSYHGTGSEEYFNSGWCIFDRKAVSGFVTARPGNVAVYSFHLNDAFQFRRYIRVVEEQMGHRSVLATHPRWGSVAYWYSQPARAADSTVGSGG